MGSDFFVLSQVLAPKICVLSLYPLSKECPYGYNACSFLFDIVLQLIYFFFFQSKDLDVILI